MSVCTYNETLESQSLSHHVGKIWDAVQLVRRQIVLGDHATRNDTTEVFHRVERCFELFATDLLSPLTLASNSDGGVTKSYILIIDINTVWCKSFECF